MNWQTSRGVSISGVSQDGFCSLWSQAMYFSAAKTVSSCAKDSTIVHDLFRGARDLDTKHRTQVPFATQAEPLGEKALITFLFNLGIPGSEREITQDGRAPSSTHVRCPSMRRYPRFWYLRGIETVCAVLMYKTNRTSPIFLTTFCSNGASNSDIVSFCTMSCSGLWGSRTSGFS